MQFHAPGKTVGLSKGNQFLQNQKPAWNRPANSWEDSVLLLHQAIGNRTMQCLLKTSPAFQGMSSRQTGGNVIRRQTNTGSVNSRNIPVRGPNPGTGLLAICEQITRGRRPRNDQEMGTIVENWRSAALECVRSGAAASNASHYAAILAHCEQEIQSDCDTFIGDMRNWPQGRQRASYLRQAPEWFADGCRRLQRQIAIEFKYNVIFDNDRNGLSWGYQPAEWNDIEAALAGMPVEATWANPLLLRFRRQECHPRDMNAAGQCAGQGTGAGQSFVGGETNLATGQITIFNSGLGQTPFGRSRGLGIPATTQTIRHEIGHVIFSQLSQNEKNNFFGGLLGWRDYSWAWLNSPPGRPANWQAERVRLRNELGFQSDAQLEAWLATLVINQPVVAGSRTYTRRDYYLKSYETAQVPGGTEFEYARTDQDEYFCELYALAISRPEFLHQTLPAAQIAWLKRVVFHTPSNHEELGRQAALADPAQSEFLIRGSRLFTHEQLDALLQELTARSQRPDQQVV